MGGKLFSFQMFRSVIFIKSYVDENINGHGQQT